MSSRDLGLDDFLNDRTGGGVDAKFLSKWNKRVPPQVDVAFHRGSPVATKVFRHNLQRLVPLEDKITRKRVVKVWSDNAVCRESEDVLKKQNKRDPDGVRLLPPQHCGICKMLEHVRSLVAVGELSWVDPIFRYMGDEEEVVIHAGGLYNAYGQWDKLSDAEKAEVVEAKIKPRESWKENANAKLNYIFRVAEYGKPDLGIQIAIETGLLGDKVKKVIRDKMESDGDDEGNPIKNPYVVRWKKVAEAKTFNDSYDANAMPKLKLDETMMELITNAKSPDISSLTEPHNPGSVRATLETHCLVDLPWDQLFDAKAEAPAVKQRPAQAQVPGKVERKQEPEPEAEFGCDECGEAMKASDTKCKSCGHEYEVEKEEAPPPPPKKALPKRSSAAKAPEPEAAEPPPAKAAKKPEAKAASKPAPIEEPADEVENDDDLPF